MNRLEPVAERVGPCRYTRHAGTGWGGYRGNGYGSMYRAMMVQAVVWVRASIDQKQSKLEKSREKSIFS